MSRNFQKTGRPYGLSESQLGIWMGQKLYPEAPLYNVGHRFQLKGSLDKARFQAAFDSLIHATPILRTVFFEEDAIPRQQEVLLKDSLLRTIDATEWENDAIDTWVAGEMQKVFAMDQPMVNAALLHLDADRHLFFLNVHHLITDAMSSTLLMELLAKAYANETSVRIAGPGYESYVANEKKAAEGHTSANSRGSGSEKEYGTFKIFGEDPPVNTTSSRRISIRLKPSFSAKIRDFSRQKPYRCFTEKLSHSNLFLTVYKLLLRRICTSADAHLGIIVGDRPAEHFRKAPGLFIRLLPYHSKTDLQESFKENYSYTVQSTNSFLKKLGSRSTSNAHSREISAVYNFIDAAFSPFADLEMHSEWLHPGHSDPNHSIRFHVQDMDNTGQFELTFDLLEGSLTKDQLEVIPEYYQFLLNAFINDPHQPAGLPSLVTEAGKVLSAAGTETETYGKDLIAQFEEIAGQYPDKLAIVHEDQELSYTALKKKADHLAAVLWAEGFRPGEKAILYLFRGSEYIISMLAVLKLKGTFVPVAAEMPSGRVEKIIANSGAQLILTSQQLTSRVAELPLGVYTVADLLERPPSPLKIVQTDFETTSSAIAYIIYTSGSTGNPKGVQISQGALHNYLNWAIGYYGSGSSFSFAFHSSISFDLTLTSIWLPLLTGGRVIVFQEADEGPDLAVVRAIRDPRVTSIKLTPSHFALLDDSATRYSKVHTIIFGGEELTTALARKTTALFAGKTISIYNEYGPTEATIGCIVHRYDPAVDTAETVPIGKPIDHMQAYVLDSFLNPVPDGVPGELYLCGKGISKGYLGELGEDKKRFLDNPFDSGGMLYRTGDFVRINHDGIFEFIGRLDDQIKLNGYRIELADIEQNLAAYEGIEQCAVVKVDATPKPKEEGVHNCKLCGLSSNYPHIDFNKEGICKLCTAFDAYSDTVRSYFKTERDLEQLLRSKRSDGPYDCIALLSGGKDSTYVLARLVDMGMRVLAFTLDNGYISDQAKRNIAQIIGRLGVDHHYGSTRHMNQIFVDSLQRHSNVCNGCFKTIYTLATQLALERNIPFIVTGLSRGQFFETRLTEELFWKPSDDSESIDNTILEARKLYHQEEDAVKEHLDVSCFNDEATFEKVQYVDFYRYCDVSLSELMSYLKEKVGWVRPLDTGRSTNCLINQLGIHVHKNTKGYSNYAFPYSWDVRLGHKTREESLEEINEYIDEGEVHRMMDEIGYVPDYDHSTQEKLAAFYTGTETPGQKLSDYVSEKLPSYMVPAIYQHLKSLPLTENGKIDRKALGRLEIKAEVRGPKVVPANEFEEMVHEVWCEVFSRDQINTTEGFLAIGGHSLAAIRITARINEQLNLELPLAKVFEFQTIRDYAAYIEKTILVLMNPEEGQNE